MLLFLRNEDGFTLVELLISLLILSLVLLIPLSFFPNTIKTKEAFLAADKLRDDVRLAQHIAMSNGARIDLSFSDQQLTLTSEGEVIAQFSYPIPIVIEAVTMDFNEIAFLENGHPRQSGTWTVVIHGQTFVYTLQLGKGRVAYREQ
ncbi:competence type IV pilus minor pilin ComGD [Bacillus sp. FSL W7-1360]